LKRGGGQFMRVIGRQSVGDQLRTVKPVSVCEEARARSRG
jgi:hypothetical protein